MSTTEEVRTAPQQSEALVRTIKINGGSTASASDVQEPLETPDGIMIKGGVRGRRQRTRKFRGGSVPSNSLGPNAFGGSHSGEAWGQTPLRGGSHLENSEPAPTSSIGVPIININKIMRGGNETASKTNIPPPPVLDSSVPKVIDPVIQQGAGSTKVVLKSKNRTAKVLLKKKTGLASESALRPSFAGAKTGHGNESALRSVSNSIKTGGSNSGLPEGGVSTLHGGSVPSNSLGPNAKPCFSGPFGGSHPGEACGQTPLRGGKILKKTGSQKQGGGSPLVNSKTRKFVVKHVSKRLKKTRHVVKQAKDIPISDLKKILITKKLIKPTSKAPESILRQIYADSLIVGKKTL